MKPDKVKGKKELFLIKLWNSSSVQINERHLHTIIGRQAFFYLVLFEQKESRIRDISFAVNGNIVVHVSLFKSLDNSKKDGIIIK